jgi:hypothetical protein
MPRLRQQRASICQTAREQFDIRRMVLRYAEVLKQAISTRKARLSGIEHPMPKAKPRVDPLRSFFRRWQYSRHYGWQR